MSSSPSRPLHPQDTGTAAPYSPSVLLAAVLALSAAIAFVVVLHVYGRRLLQRRPSASAAAAGVAGNPHSLRDPSNSYEFEAGVAVREGLDAKDLASLPVFVCTAKDGAVQCVVCLGEMDGGELGRLLPACRHAFHAECIDAWLSCSSTCPVCRMKVRTAEATVSLPRVADC